MNHTIKHWTGRALMAMAVASVFTACSDDHFDTNSDVAGRNTLWGNIETNPQLSQFKSILEQLHVTKNQGATTTPQTYADLLNRDQTFTVWAPADGTFNYENWKALLDEGTAESNYKVEKELIQNCMTRYTYPLSGNDSTLLYLFNSKTAMFNCKAGTIRGHQITSSNISSKNGMLHVTDGAVDYLPNLYDYIMEAEGIDSLRQFVRRYENTEFNENASTQGPTVNGNITWVDSVTYTFNEFTRYYMGANLSQEDSTYSIILPNNKAWSETTEKYKKYFKYIPEYVQNIVSISDDGTETTEQKTTKFTAQELDSITRLRVATVLCRDLVFNNNSQYEHTANQLPIPGACDSIRSTNGNVFKDPLSASLFDGKTATQVSNGFAYIVDNYNYDPTLTWLNKKKVSALNYESYSYCNPMGTRYNMLVEYEDLNGETRDTTMDLTVLTLYPTRATANTSVTIRINNLYSCKYDIYAVMAWNTDAEKPYHFRSYINYHNNQRTSTRTQLTPPEGQLSDGRYFVTREPWIDEQGIHYTDSVLLAKDFSFPTCYAGIDDAYVTLEIGSYLTSSQRNNYTNELIIDKIILVPKYEE